MLSKNAIETSGARCFLPKRLSKRRLNTVSPSKFRCKGITIKDAIFEKIIDNKLNKKSKKSIFF